MNVFNTRNCPDGWKELNKNCYKYVDSAKTWADAENVCKLHTWDGVQGHLASVHSEEENHFVARLAKETIWLGHHDLKMEGHWTWTDGTAFTYKNWAKGEPNNHGNNEDCMELYSPSSKEKQWNDDVCTKPAKFVCKLTKVFAGQCVVDDSSRLLDDYTPFHNILTPNLCIKNCLDKNFRYAGVQNGGECFCGDTAPPPSKLVGQADCKTNCHGDASQKCGGTWRMNVFDSRLPLSDEKAVFRHGYAYQYFPYNGERLDFKVEAKTDAHIALDSDENDSDLYEIVIGGYGNSLSMVRRGKQGPNIGTGTVDKGSSPGQKGWTETPSILSSTEFRGFWITTEYVNNKLEIKVGRDGESKPFMTGTDPKPLKVQKFGLSAYADYDATYIF